MFWEDKEKIAYGTIIMQSRWVVGEFIVLLNWFNGSQWLQGVHISYNPYNIYRIPEKFFKINNLTYSQVSYGKKIDLYSIIYRTSFNK